MKILHTADLHLASTMERHLSPEKAKQRRAELLGVFADLAKTAKSESVAALLLCGDIADISDLPGATKRYVLDTLADLAPIPVLIIRGNHDPKLLSDVVLPENVTLFSDTWSSVLLQDDDMTVLVSARTLPAQTVVADAFMEGYPAAHTADAHVVMLHGALADTTVFGGEDFLLSRKALSDKGIDYLALGHIHAYSMENMDRNCLACYPGVLAGRGFDECGEKGYVMLDLTKNLDKSVKIATEFRKTNSRMYHHIRVDVSVLLQEAFALEHAVDDATSPIPERDIVRIELIGEDDPDMERDLSLISARLAQRFYASELRDSRTVRIDMESLARDASLKGVFVKNVLSSDLSDEDKAEIIRMGIGALRGS